MRPVLISWSLAPRPLHRTLLTDRDGVLGSVHLDRPGPPWVAAFEGTQPALHLLSGRGVAVVVVTNQGAVGRGEHSMKRVLDANEELLRLLDPGRTLIDFVAVCPHSATQGCECRKPRTGAVRALEHLAGSRIGQGWVVGDRDSDMEFAQRLGMPGFRVGDGRELYDREPMQRALRTTHVTDFAAAVADVVSEL